MKKTGVIRRIDNLGRIVIPKEIRSTLRIKNGDNLEIYVNENDDIVLRKFSIIDKLFDLSSSITESINSVTRGVAIITNNDTYISVCGKHKRSIEGESISNEVSDIISGTNDISKGKGIYLTSDKSFDEFYLIVPIISSGDKVGAIILLSDDEVSLEVESSIKLAASFLGTYVE